MNRIELLQQILEKYHFEAPIPPEVKRRSARARKKTLVHILRRAGYYSFFASLIISIYFFMKKIGLGLSVSKCVILLAGAGVTTTAMIGTGTYLTVSYIQQQKSMPHLENPATTPEQAQENRTQQEADTRRSRQQKHHYPKTIKGLKLKYGRVDLITLYNGRIIEGAIISRGTTYTIVTTGGVVKIPQNQIRSKKIIK